MSVKETTYQFNKNSSTATFKSSDYDLDKDERKVKYKDYDCVLCEECDKEISRDWHCKRCYRERTDEEKYRMLYGKCNVCSKVMKTRHWCSGCNSEKFQQDFDENIWTSGNKLIDELILDNQISACSNHILEWISYDSFTDIKDLAEGGFAKVCSATWKSGRIEKWDHESNKWRRSGPTRVALKILNSNSRNLSEDFLNELKFLKYFPSSYYIYIIECYGITRVNSNYALVLKLKERSLRSYLDENYNSMTLEDKLDIIKSICLGLNCIHSHNIIHRDLHPKNILHSLTDKKKSDISISDFGFCDPLREASASKIYGVMPYIAPEIWHGKSYTKKSDIYSFGIIINEIISGNKSFDDIPHDNLLINEICRGIRPKIRTETPKPLKELIEKCWDCSPDNRPDTDQVYGMLRDFMYKKNARGSYNFKEHTEQYKKLQKSSYKAEKTHFIGSSNLLTINSNVKEDASIREFSRSSNYSDCRIPDLALGIRNGAEDAEGKKHIEQYENLEDLYEKLTITVDPPSDSYSKKYLNIGSSSNLPIPVNTKPTLIVERGAGISKFAEYSDSDCFDCTISTDI